MLQSPIPEPLRVENFHAVVIFSHYPALVDTAIVKMTTGASTDGLLPLHPEDVRQIRDWCDKWLAAIAPPSEGVPNQSADSDSNVQHDFVSIDKLSGKLRVWGNENGTIGVLQTYLLEPKRLGIVLTLREASALRDWLIKHCDEWLTKQAAPPQMEADSEPAEGFSSTNMGPTGKRPARMNAIQIHGFERDRKFSLRVSQPTLGPERISLKAFGPRGEFISVHLDLDGVIQLEEFCQEWLRRRSPSNEIQFQGTGSVRESADDPLELLLRDFDTRMYLPSPLPELLRGIWNRVRSLETKICGRAAP